MLVGVAKQIVLAGTAHICVKAAEIVVAALDFEGGSVLVVSHVLNELVYQIEVKVFVLEKFVEQSILFLLQINLFLFL